MPGNARAADERVNPALVEAMLRRRRNTALLYWRFARPRGRVYAVAAAKFGAYRLAAAGMMLISLVLTSFLGALAGAIGYHRWPAVQDINGNLITSASRQASVFACHYGLVTAAFSLALVIIPRPHRWIFRIAVLISVALGYFRVILPAFPWPSLPSGFVSHVAMITTSGFSQTSNVSGLLLGAIAFAAYFFYRRASAFTTGAAKSIPRRPKNHGYSSFIAVGPGWRLMAATVTAALLAVDFWLVESARALLPRLHDFATSGWSVRFSLVGLLLVVAAAGLACCAPRPNGYRWLLVTLLAGVLIAGFWPQNVFPLPAGFPGPNYGFWVLVIAYIPVTGVAFDLVSALLDWPI
jgi:hypothetical protein